MRIKLDENLPVECKADLHTLGHDVHTIEDERLSGHDDQEIWRAAQNEKRFLITQDLDFSDLRRYAPGQHSGILLLRLKWPSRARLASRIEAIFRVEPVETWTGCFAVATEQKVRVRRIPNN